MLVIVRGWDGKCQGCKVLRKLDQGREDGRIWDVAIILQRSDGGVHSWQRVRESWDPEGWGKSDV
jgi:hypothetical protein